MLDSDWGDAQPNAEIENAYLDKHTWTAYANWHLGLTVGANDETKARYAFVVGDYRRVHRTGPHRLRLPGLGVAAQSVELAAHDLLQHLDQTLADPSLQNQR